MHGIACIGFIDRSSERGLCSLEKLLHPNNLTVGHHASIPVDDHLALKDPIARWVRSCQQCRHPAAMLGKGKSQERRMLLRKPRKIASGDVVTPGSSGDGHA